MSFAKDTIAAQATPPGRGGVGIVRVSGPAVCNLTQMVTGRSLPARQAVLTDFFGANGQPIDTGLAIYFPAPHSFTGEDVLELQGHGSPAVMDLLVARLLKAGARMARPGEFSERAFLNNRLDLAQAEAIADLIDAGSAAAAAAAMRSLQGEFSQRVAQLVETLVELRVYVEAAIDFSDEEVDFLSTGQVGQRLAGLQTNLADLLRAARCGSALRDGLRVALAGAPNVGKSSLLNRLAQRDAAIVTDVPGTTRDVLREQITLDGMPLHIVDTAGLRDTVDPVEAEGVRRARQELEQADRILLVLDDREDAGQIAGQASDWPTDQVTIIRNKCDLSGAAPGALTSAPQPQIRLSATTGAGVDALVAHLGELAGLADSAGSVFSARRRHLDAIRRAQDALSAGRHQIEVNDAGELLAEELRLAQTALGEITGEFTSEDLLGEIFSSFCIGK